LGNFSTYSWLKYAAQAGLREAGTPAHNLWYLTLGEVGYPGLFAFIVYWLRFYSIGLPFLFRRRTDLIYAVAASATAASLIGHIQNMLQLSYRQTSIYMFNKILMAMVVAAWYIDRDTRRAERDARRLARNRNV
jgi:TctA family transporter